MGEAEHRQHTLVSSKGFKKSDQRKEINDKHTNTQRPTPEGCETKQLFSLRETHNGRTLCGGGGGSTCHCSLHLCPHQQDLTGEAAKDFKVWCRLFTPVSHFIYITFDLLLLRWPLPPHTHDMCHFSSQWGLRHDWLWVIPLLKGLTANKGKPAAGLRQWLRQIVQNMRTYAGSAQAG